MLDEQSFVIKHPIIFDCSQLAVDVFTSFRQLFIKTRRKIRGDGWSRTTTPAAGTRSTTPANRSVTPNGSHMEWDFPSSMIFARADAFADRLKQLKVKFERFIMSLIGF